MSDAEMKAVVDAVAADPMLGDAIVGSGGCRKVRFAGRGKGKSGGYRVITFFSGEDIPAFLLTVFGKGEKSTLRDGEVKALAVATKALAEAYRQQARKIRAIK